MPKLVNRSLLAGSDATAAATELAQVIGPPRSDSGWVVGCPLDGPEVNERTLTWGSLVVSLQRDGAADVVRSWHYRLGQTTGRPDRGGPPVSQVLLPGGVSFGTPIGEVADALDEPLLQEFFGYYLDLDGLLLYSNSGAGAATDTDPVDGVGVPYIPVCD